MNQTRCVTQDKQAHIETVYACVISAVFWLKNGANYLVIGSVPRPICAASVSYFLLFELPVFVVTLQSVSKCHNAFIVYVLFECCLIFELFGLMTAK